MKSELSWTPTEPDLETILRTHELPLEDLAQGHVPALVIRAAWSPQECQQLVQRLIDEELLYDPHQTIPEKFLQRIIPEGYYREGRKEMPARSRDEGHQERAKTRIDIGTSLGYRGSNRNEFFAHSKETNQLLDRLFESHQNPVQILYDALTGVARGKEVMTACESDGRGYGRAIIRAHYGGYTYKPHFDSVRLREKRSDYMVSQYEHQFAGVLVLQNTKLEDRSAQGIIHHCLWRPEIDPYLKAGTFTEYAAEQRISSVEICLEPGDLYFFNTRMIHEVPGLAGELPRIVLATFIGYHSGRDNIVVWA